MKVTRTSEFTGNVSTREIDITRNQLFDYYKNNKKIQDVFPQLSNDDREFILTGCTPKEWECLFGLEE